MHHELFFALLGVCGELIVEKRDPQKNIVTSFVFDSNVSPAMLTDGDRQLLQPILHLGYCYRRLSLFSRSPCTVVNSSGSYMSNSLYVHSVQQSIAKTLVAYEAHVASLEQRILASAMEINSNHSGGLFPFSHLLVELRAEMETFPFLCRLVEHIEKKKLHGKWVLELLQAHENSGFPEIRECARLFLANAHRVLYRQMMSWMTTAELIDPFGEFFVSSAKQNELSVDLTRVPLRYFPSSLAEDILFIGKAMKILTDDPSHHQDICRVLHSLSVQTSWNTHLVQESLESLRVQIASALGQRVVVQGQFIKWLRGIKTFYLLGEGDFFHAVVERTFPIFVQPPVQRSEGDLNHGIWSSTLREYQLDTPFSVSLQVPLQSFVYKHLHEIPAGLVLVGAPPDTQVSGLQCMPSSPPVPLACWCRHVQYLSRSFQSCILLKTPLEQTEISFVMQTEGVHVIPTCDKASVNLNSQSFVALQFQFTIVRESTVQVTARLWLTQVEKRLVHETSTLLKYSPDVEILIDYGATKDKEKRLQYGWRVHIQEKRCFECPMNLLTEVEVLSSRKGGVHVGLVLLPGVNVENWSFQKHDEDPWAYVGLQLEVKWPLPLLLTSSALVTYNHMFHMLFRLKRILYALNQTWKQSREMSAASCLLRHDILHVLSNLFLYYQMGVVDVNFNQCVAECEKTADFDVVKRLHDNFVASLAKKCYLYATTVVHAVDQIIAMAWSFCMDPSAMLQIEYRKRIDCLCTVLANTDARELVIQLDYNGYISEQRGVSP
ncbi:Aste57867_22588 [Aphanomyces stellatus]|uniref:Spindle pole body component n=1 Tax=Aphanomyces stellatus TaxID=120398 RepID=A0A485LLB0_9STRA|nr:hypothetical protein As57867_022518 [Aphanomyces stellatus]KAF0706098.1 hypothetical protein As57867_006800 [Aphanomyces stellatus]VFT83784.1 Aste57867_6820 [Aphanomyces stellatus]VFT99245.1 Aste57867_22588 [Aphanomyces stellatus]